MTRAEELELAVKEIEKTLQGTKGYYTPEEVLDFSKVSMYEAYDGDIVPDFEDSNINSIAELVLLTRILVNEYNQGTLGELVE